MWWWQSPGSGFAVRAGHPRSQSSAPVFDGGFLLGSSPGPRSGTAAPMEAGALLLNLHGGGHGFEGSEHLGKAIMPPLGARKHDVWQEGEKLLEVILARNAREEGFNSEPQPAGRKDGFKFVGHEQPHYLVLHNTMAQTRCF